MSYGIHNHIFINCLKFLTTHRHCDWHGTDFELLLKSMKCTINYNRLIPEFCIGNFDEITWKV